MTHTSKTPLVSVLLPVYNNMPYLPEAAQSILDQTFTDFELIIIDDGSTDRSPQVLREFAQRDPRIRLTLRDHNEGLDAGLIEGVEQARGRYIARMDADDVSLPHRLHRQVEHLESHPEVVLVGSRVMLIDPDGAPICEFARETTHEEIDRAHLELRWPIVHPAIMFRKKEMLEAGGYRRQYESLEDFDLFLRMAERGRLENIPEVLLHYRQHCDSMCVTWRDRQNAIRETIYRDACARRGIPVEKDSTAFVAPQRSAARLSERWAWLALAAGNLATARKHALRSIFREPWMLDSWRVAFCALRGH